MSFWIVELMGAYVCEDKALKISKWNLTEVVLTLALEAGFQDLELPFGEDLGSLLEEGC